MVLIPISLVILSWASKCRKHVRLKTPLGNYLLIPAMDVTWLHFSPWDPLIVAMGREAIAGDPSAVRAISAASSWSMASVSRSAAMDSSRHPQIYQ